jgi:hypothetical protein
MNDGEVMASPERRAAFDKYMSNAHEQERMYYVHERATRAVNAAADRIANHVVTQEHIENHPLVQAARAVHDVAEARLAQMRQEHQQLERAANEAQRQVEIAKGHLDVARGGTGVRFDFQDRIGEPGSAQRALDKTFGRAMSKEDIAKLSGARLGDRVFVAESGANGVHVWVKGNIERNFEVTRQGNAVVLHDHITRNMAEKTSGSGRDLIQGFDNMRAMGITKLVATAARGPSLNGYHTWAKLGFTGKIPEHLRADVQTQFGSRVTRVERLMAQKGGAQWWKQHGDNWEATFLFGKGSHSMKVLNEFRAKLERHSDGGDNG